jgi:hypothetical protein
MIGTGSSEEDGLRNALGELAVGRGSRYEQASVFAAGVTRF